ncbi:MAG: response regulator [Candidatus Omnitrophica bacterium]|nr:response regulator [Candidatus Omnitrophota bacterium]
MAKVLVVDDEQMLRERLKGLLELEDYEVFLADSGLQALEVMKEIKPEIVVSDIRMPGMDGIELLDKIKAASIETEVIMLTGHGAMESAISALKKGAFDYMPKPVNFDELCIAIKRALASQKQRQQLVFQQAQLVRAEKLTAVGELGAGVAHEMNQPLMAISTHLETLLMNDAISQNPALKTKITKIKDQFTRLGTIVKRVHAYSGSRKEGFVQENINRPVQDGLFLFQQQFKDHNIEVTLELEEGIPPMYIDRYSLQDVIINFMVNARDALDDKFDQKEGGAVKIISKKLDHLQAVIVGLIDNGIPVKGGSEGSLFDPFFTTKAPGKGTGLGLSVSYNIIQAHGGVIDFSPLKNDRKIFYFVLPLDKRHNMLTAAAIHDELKIVWESL